MSRRVRRILTWEEFTATPRTPAELASYQPLLSRLKAMGLVDDDLNLTESARRKVR